MKKVLAMAAVAALAAGASVYAANPFSDVSTSDWAYQAVSDLSDQGVVEGYPDGTFKGQNNITRYEMAQIIARLMAKEDQLNAEQRATLDKLAGEYADELDTLGVRVSNLEKKVGNISWSGDARMRYQDNGEKGDSYNGRLRINVKGQVNDSTAVVGRLTTNFWFKDAGKAAGNDGDTLMDILYVDHKFGDAAEVKLGRYPLAFGDQGGWYYNAADGVDGAEASFNLGKAVKVAVGYGQFNTNNTWGKKAETANSSVDLFYAKGKANLGFATLGVDYIANKDNGYNKASQDGGNGFKDAEIIGGNLVVPVGDFQVFGDYFKNTTAVNYDTAWNVGLGYGKLDLKKPGSFALSAAYYDVDGNVYFGGTGLQTAVIGNVENGNSKATNLTFWNVVGDVAVAQNTFLHAEYAFAADAEDGNKQGVKDPDNSWTVSLNYVF